MKKVHFGAIVFSGLLVANVALAQEPPLPPEVQGNPSDMPAAPSTVAADAALPGQAGPEPVLPSPPSPSDVDAADKSTKSGWSIYSKLFVNTDLKPTGSLGGEARHEIKTPDFKDQPSGSADGTHTALIATGRVDLGNQAISGSAGHVANGGLLAIEAKHGNYSDTPLMKETRGAVARLAYERAAAEGQVGAGTLAVGYMKSQGRETAPTGTYTQMPVQTGGSTRFTVLAAVGKGRVDGIQSKQSWELNAEGEAALQHCFALNPAKDKNFCLTAIFAGKIGTQLSMGVSGLARYATPLSTDSNNKQLVYIGLGANTTVSSSLFEPNQGSSTAGAALVGGITTN